MMIPVAIRDEAKADLREAVAWYEAERAGLGGRFVREFAVYLEMIAENPLAYSPAEKGVRRVAMKQFPYVIYFQALPDRIAVLAVLHGRRSMATWKKRL